MPCLVGQLAAADERFSVGGGSFLFLFLLPVTIHHAGCAYAVVRSAAATCGQVCRGSSVSSYENAWGNGVHIHSGPTLCCFGWCTLVFSLLFDAMIPR